MTATPAPARTLRTTSAPPLGQRRVAERARCPVPVENRLALLFGLALLEQGFAPEQAARYVRQALEQTIPT